MIRSTSRSWRTAAALTLLAVVAAACGGGGVNSAESVIARDFERVGGSGSSNTFWSERPVSDSVNVIQAAARPTDTIEVNGGRFLQYSDGVVAVWDCSTSDSQAAEGVDTQAAAEAPSQQTEADLGADIRSGCQSGETGSVVYVDEYSRGRTRWYPYVGRRWGTFASPGRSFRGGGSGGGGK